MTVKQRKHLSVRELREPSNVDSKRQEDKAVLATHNVWNKIIDKYPELDFQSLRTLKMNFLDHKFAIDYMNRGYLLEGKPVKNINDLQAHKARGIKPDGGIFFVKSHKDNFLHIVCALEVKKQGNYNGYTPISPSDWRKKNPDNDNMPEAKDRSPQAQGNAIERFAKNANAIKTLTSFYGYNPYIVMCEGFDFYLKDNYNIFKNQKFSNKYKNADSAIIMRLIAGNDWLPINKVYVDCIQHGKSKVCPATIFAHMPKWSTEEIEDIMLQVIDKSLTHLKAIGEI